MPFGIGIWELLILLLVLLLVFGPKRLPEMGRQLGKGMREFKGSVTGMTDAMDLSDEPAPAAQPARPAQSAPALPPAQPTPADASERETVDVSAEPASDDARPAGSGAT
jgi:sec-independent protein translocase protein TatA